MRQFWAFFRVAVADALVYRAEGAVWMLLEVSQPVVALIFWLAAFQTKSDIAGYSLTSMVLYYFGIMFVNNLVATHPQYELSREIRSGSFSYYLLRPVSLSVYKIAAGSSWRVVRILFFLPQILLLVPIFHLDLSSLSFSPAKILAILVSVFMAFWLHFFAKMILGLTTIWFTEAGWLFLSFNVINSFFSGQLIPLDLFPAKLLHFTNFLPFKYFLYFPVSLSLNRLNQANAVILGLAVQFFWCLLFYWLYHLVLKRGTKAYSAYGG